jgi:hypothetical protein
MGIENIHLYDQTLAFIRTDARYTVIHDSGLINAEGGKAVNAWEALAHEFQHYWRHVIAEEVAAALDINPLEPNLLLQTIWKTNDKSE